MGVIRKRQGVKTALGISNPDRLLNMEGYFFQAGDDHIRLIQLYPHCKRKDTVFQGLFPMLPFKVVYRFMGKIVKKIALALKIIKKGLVAYELDVVRPFKCLAGAFGKESITEVKKIP